MALFSFLQKRTNMKIAIIGAMEEEVTLLKNSLQKRSQTEYYHLDLIEGELDSHQVVLVQSGIGKVAATIATTLLIEKFQPDLIINTGSAGGFDQELNIGDIVIAESLIQHDVDVTHFGYKLGQVPSMPAQFVADPGFSQLAFDAANELDEI